MACVPNPKLLAQRNLFALSEKTYVGRGIVAGLDDTGQNRILVSWIMGRSDKSQNRLYSTGSNGRVFTMPANLKKVEKEDLSLIIYNAMMESHGFGKRVYVASNGSQTDAVARAMVPTFGRSSLTIERALRDYSYEPDPPINTPRITAVACMQWPYIQWALLRKSASSDYCDRLHYQYGLVPGFGHCLTTYVDNGDPPPPFMGEPYLVPLDGDHNEIANTYWKTLNPSYRVSLAVKLIARNGDSYIVLRNRFSRA